MARDLVKPSKRPLRLVTANGEVLGGGDKGVELMIHSLQRNAEAKPGFERVWKAKGFFHEADIDDDMGLGYPWLQENRVAVLPGDNALGVGESCQCLVEGWPVTDARPTAKTPS